MAKITETLREEEIVENRGNVEKISFPDKILNRYVDHYPCATYSRLPMLWSRSRKEPKLWLALEQ